VGYHIIFWEEEQRGYGLQIQQLWFRRYLICKSLEKEFLPIYQKKLRDQIRKGRNVLNFLKQPKDQSKIKLWKEYLQLLVYKNSSLYTILLYDFILKMLYFNQLL